MTKKETCPACGNSNRDLIEEEPQAHGPLCPSRVCGECLCGVADRAIALAEQEGQWIEREGH